VSEFRKDPLTGSWVIIASGRAKRPRQFGALKHSSQAEPCPFCAGNETMTPPEVWAKRQNQSGDNGPSWTVRVVPNKYPALAAESEARDSSEQFYQSRRGLGAHEVIIESPKHDVSLARVSASQFVAIVQAYRTRMRALSQDPRWRYALLYKNQGDRAGATLQHIHSQLIALAAAPKAALKELRGARLYYQTTGRCAYCEIIEREVEKRERIIFEHENFVVLCPFAPRFAYETWILPKTHSADFAASAEPGLSDFARALHETITRLDRALGDPPFNYVLHSMPMDEATRHYYHWQLKILPQLSRAAGFEWGTGAHINAVAPEEAARLLRDALL
jgi:UDPglucose--hexose-1-phosphate uridylyltransferase